MRFLFKTYVFDNEARRLIRAGVTVRLSPKALLLLDCLLQRRPAVVPHRELRDLLWPDTNVGMNSLSQVVVELRRAFGGHDNGLIRTAHRAGYAFDGEAVEQTGSAARSERPRQSLRWGGVEIVLHQGENVMGRGEECDCRIAAPRVSRRHARIILCGRNAVIEDLGSKNGTHVGGRRVNGPWSLVHGDVILLGHEPVVFTVADPQDTTETDGP